VTKRRAVPALLLLAWLTATGAFGTCDYFKPTEPELPADLDPIIPDYSNPTLALETIARGIEDKSLTNGQDVYMGAFADSGVAGGDGRAFHAFFDPADLSLHQSTWDPARNDWNRELEPRVYGALVRLYSPPYEMTWKPYPPPGSESGSADDSLVHRQYEIVRVVRNGNTTTRTPFVVGAATLHFVRSDRTPSKWVIATWQDFRMQGIEYGTAITTYGKRRLENQ
jgi:hypothetical protein